MFVYLLPPKVALLLLVGVKLIFSLCHFVLKLYFNSNPNVFGACKKTNYIFSKVTRNFLRSFSIGFFRGPILLPHIFVSKPNEGVKFYCKHRKSANTTSVLLHFGAFLGTDATSIAMHIIRIIEMRFAIRCRNHELNFIENPS